MTLEELLAAWEAAQAKAKADPENEELKTAAEAAKKAYDDAKAEADADEGEPDESALDAKTKRYIEKLRKEAAGHRTKAKDLKSKLSAEEERKKAILKAAGIESEDDEPAEEKLQKSRTAQDQLTFRNAILETAVRQGIAADDLEFFEFLVTKKVGELEDGDELSDEQMAEIVKKIRGGKATGKPSSAGAGKGSPNPEGNKGAVTLDKFVSMTMSEKSKLYADNPGLYQELVTQAKQKKRLV